MHKKLLVLFFSILLFSFSITSNASYLNFHFSSKEEEINKLKDEINKLNSIIIEYQSRDLQRTNKSISTIRDNQDTSIIYNIDQIYSSISSFYEKAFQQLLYLISGVGVFVSLLLGYFQNHNSKMLRKQEEQTYEKIKNDLEEVLKKQLEEKEKYTNELKKDFDNKINKLKCDLILNEFNREILNSLTKKNPINKIASFERLNKELTSKYKDIPDNEKAKLFYHLGNELQSNKNYQLAIENYERAIKFNPNYMDAINNYALALYALKNSDKAIKTLKQCLDSSDPYTKNTAYLNLSEIYIGINNFSKGLEYFALLPDNFQGKIDINKETYNLLLSYVTSLSNSQIDSKIKNNIKEKSRFNIKTSN